MMMVAFGRKDLRLTEFVWVELWLGVVWLSRSGFVDV